MQNQSIAQYNPAKVYKMKWLKNLNFHKTMAHAQNTMPCTSVQDDEVTKESEFP